MLGSIQNFYGMFRMNWVFFLNPVTVQQTTALYILLNNCFVADALRQVIAVFDSHMTGCRV